MNLKGKIVEDLQDGVHVYVQLLGKNRLIFSYKLVHAFRGHNRGRYLGSQR